MAGFDSTTDTRARWAILRAPRSRIATGRKALGNIKRQFLTFTPIPQKEQTNRNEESSGTVGKYDAETGFTINRHFITGLHSPTGLAVTGNTLFVANTDDGTVGKYDANNGAAINAGFITGLGEPVGLAVADNTLFVTSPNRGTVGA